MALLSVTRADLALHVEAAGGRLAVGRDEGEFSLVAEIPLPARA
ncbi:MAG TPA: hypothetical protein VF482_12675 [Trebonia sp.]